MVMVMKMIEMKVIICIINIVIIIIIVCIELSIRIADETAQAHAYINWGQVNAAIACIESGRRRIIQFTTYICCLY